MADELKLTKSKPKASSPLKHNIAKQNRQSKHSTTTKRKPFSNKMGRRRSLPTISEEVQFRDMGSFRFRRSFRAKSFNKKRSLSSTTDCVPSSFDFSNLAPSDRKRIARLEACLEKIGLRKRQPLQRSKSLTNMYPTASSVEAIPDIDPKDVLEESIFRSGHLDSSNSQDEAFFRVWQENTHGCAQDKNQSMDDAIYLEVEKGTYEKLRGSKEMLHAINLGFLTGTQCLACSCRLYCIADAALVLCPECRMISPTNPNCNDKTLVIPCHGVGLGVRA